VKHRSVAVLCVQMRAPLSTFGSVGMLLAEHRGSSAMRRSRQRVAAHRVRLRNKRGTELTLLKSGEQPCQLGMYQVQQPLSEKLVGSHRGLEKAGVILAIFQCLDNGGFKRGKQARLTLVLAFAPLGQVRHPPRREHSSHGVLNACAPLAVGVGQSTRHHIRCYMMRPWARRHVQRSSMVACAPPDVLSTNNTAYQHEEQKQQQ
jgi:hypothetical protein